MTLIKTTVNALGIVGLVALSSPSLARNDFECSYIKYAPNYGICGRAYPGRNDTLKDSLNDPECYESEENYTRCIARFYALDRNGDCKVNNEDDLNNDGYIDARDNLVNPKLSLCSSKLRK